MTLLSLLLGCMTGERDCRMTDSRRSITDVAAGDRRGELESARAVRMETRAAWADLRGCRGEGLGFNNRCIY